jgi:Flp pilus assembly protein protease CpaA
MIALPGFLLPGLIVGLIALLISSLIDIKTREVPDWISYSVIVFAIGNALILSLAKQDTSFIIQSLLGLLIGVLIGWFMFYTGQWGGGDSKLIMGLCALIGFNPWLIAEQQPALLLLLMINILIVGAIYGIIFSLIKAALNFKVCKKQAEEKAKTKAFVIVRIIVIISLVASIIFLISKPGFKSAILFGFAAMIFIFMYLWLIISSVEKTCMTMNIPLAKLTEGDWIVADVMKNKKLLLKPTKTGVTLEQMALLKKNKIKDVTIKIGIPFVPSFLVAYVLTFIFGNWLVYLMM